MTGVPCGCSRSKSGFCDGSHGLSPEQWTKLQESIKKDQFLNEKKDRGNEMAG